MYLLVEGVHQQAQAGQHVTICGEGVGPGGVYSFVRTAEGARGLVLSSWLQDTKPATVDRGRGESRGVTD